MSGTIDVYDRMANEYVALFKGDYPAELDWFMSQVRHGGRVIDLGCGPGHHAARMAVAGLDVLAVDGSAEMISLTAARPGLTARQAGFDEIADLGTTDGIWANFSLLHAPRSDFPRHLADLNALCRGQSPLVIGMKLGNGERTDHLGRFYTYYSETELNTHLSDAGFTVLDARLGSEKGLAGQVDPFIVITARA